MLGRGGGREKQQVKIEGMARGDGGEIERACWWRICEGRMCRVVFSTMSDLALEAFYEKGVSTHQTTPAILGTCFGVACLLSDIPKYTNCQSLWM